MSARFALMESKMLGSPSFNFTFQVDNFGTNPPDTTNPLVGTSVTPTGVVNTKSSGTTLLSALAADCNYLIVGFSNTLLSGANKQFIADILVDPAGGTTWSVKIADLVCGMYVAQTGGVTVPLWYHFPLWIPAGASVGVSLASASTNTNVVKVVSVVYGEPSRPEMWWCGQGVESLGINSSISEGTRITPGTSGTYSAWSTVGTANFHYGAVQMGVNGSDATAAANNYYWQIGVSSAQLPGSPRFYRSLLATEQGTAIGSLGPLWCNVSSGTVWQLRATGSSVAAEQFNAAIYGVY